MKRLLAVVVTAVVVLAGCGDDDEASTNPTIPPVTEVAVGEKVTLAGGQTIQVFGYEANVATDQPPAFEADSFSVIDVEACGGQGEDVDPSKFRLLLSDNSRVTPSFRVVKEPGMQAVGQPGQCSRGTVTFELSPNRQPSTVSYLSTAANVRWRLA